MATMAAMAAPVAEIDVANRGYHHVARAATLQLGPCSKMIETIGAFLHLLGNFGRRHFRCFFRHGPHPVERSRCGADRPSA